MSSEFFFYNNPYFWILLTALFSGAGVSRITMLTGKAGDKKKARMRKWIMVCLYFSVAMIFLVCAIFIPGPEHFMKPGLLYAYAGGTLLFFLVFRFKKAVGLPFVSLFILFFVLFLLFLQSLTAFSGETLVASLRVLEAEKGNMKLEISWDKDNPYASEIIELEGQYFAPVAKMVIFEDYLVFFGARTWYRLLGLRAFSEPEKGELTVQSDAYELEYPRGIGEELYAFIEANETRLPGIRTTQFGSAEKKAQPGGEYRVFVQNNGSLIIIKE